MTEAAVSFHGILDDGVRSQALWPTFLGKLRAGDRLQGIASEDMSHPDAPNSQHVPAAFRTAPLKPWAEAASAHLPW